MSARLVGAVSVAVLACAATALATPIAHNDSERALYGGRVIPEPIQSVNYLQFGSNGSEAEFSDALSELQRTYGRYIRLTTVADELHDRNAVSTGLDGIPAGTPGDTGDGHPLYVVVLTDRTLPDAGKQYVSLMFAHSAEPCGREGELRSIEDLAKGAAERSPTTYDDGKGTTGARHAYTAAELLAKTKIFVSVTSPDGWAKGDNDAGYDQNNGAGINSNRVAPQDGWDYTGDVLYRHGYSTATQSEGLAFMRYLLDVRQRELGGRPFAEGADMHGPLPFGYILLHDQGNDAAKTERNYETAVRVKAAMDAVHQRYATGGGSSGYEAVASQGESVQKLLAQFKPDTGHGALDPTRLPLQWATFSQIWDILGYTAGSSWGGWMNSFAGLDADSISYEINCVLYAPYDPAQMQLFVDNVRAILDTTIVRAAAREAAPSVDLQGPVGFYDDGTRVSSADGNPSPPPAGFPNRPLLKQVEQVPYDVSQTDWFRQVGDGVAGSPVREVRPGDLPASLPGLATLAVADQEPADTAALSRFVSDGGNLVLTDRALKLLPALGVGRPQDVGQGYGYVGYADLDFGDPLTAGIPKYARQTYDPIGLGYPTLMERDFYYGCRTGDTECANETDSGTQNSAPIWWIDKAALAGVKGARVVGTVDPPASRKGQGEGSAADKVEIGIVPVGAGRIVFFGAALPRPTEGHPHWYGLDAQTLSHAAQTMLLRALTWRAPGIAAASGGKACHSRRHVTIRLRVGRADRLRSARVLVNGRRARAAHGRRSVLLDLSGRLAGRYTIRIYARTARGRALQTIRRYRTCVQRARSARPAARASGTPFHSSADHHYDPFSGVLVTPGAS
jgi:hypothetical protein